jgi:hypothetical protein
MVVYSRIYETQYTRYREIIEILILKQVVHIFIVTSVI